MLRGFLLRLKEMNFLNLVGSQAGMAHFKGDCTALSDNFPPKERKLPFKYLLWFKRNKRLEKTQRET